ncbi:hypothetical protein HNP52_004587 [Sphingomonas kyeonggiensis]|uniref:Uncharacterized protein n=1 Tax=Sphingomonas kyeonggiensis TaxID=1268553 RepID=A0A7W7K6B6_9SPHN|nr:hypothetical protein [Sphingomonas kyeonggiensis]MBB4841483.1 hypothetical protein [Sphingomonas kyeonggiensis]
MKNAFLTVEAVGAMITSGATLFISGPEALLRQLPRGKWIGGTTAYFILEDGGVSREDRLFCTCFDEAMDVRTAILSSDQLSGLVERRYDHGFTCVMAPAFSGALQRYAVEGPGLPGLYDQPVFGCVAGVRLDRVDTEMPKVFDGAAGTFSHDGLAALWVELPETIEVDLDIVNLFTVGVGSEFSFAEGGFEVAECLVDGRPTNLARHIEEQGLDTRLPLVADYAGAMINVSFQAVDADNGRVRFYAPVVPGVIYRLARPVADYALAYVDAAKGRSAAGMLSCNCILNYLYAELEGCSTGGFVGPVTFGEFAYILLNQTLSCLSLRDVPAEHK